MNWVDELKNTIMVIFNNPSNTSFIELILILILSVLLLVFFTRKLIH